MTESYTFRADWFSRFTPVWTQLLDRYKPSKVLEIGSFEGRSTCFLIDQIAAKRDLELHCVDTWEGGVEHETIEMEIIEQTFDSNIAIARKAAAQKVDFHKHRALSSVALTKLLAEGHADSFDLVYVDGSHQAPDVLTDAVLSFMLTKVGGLLFFDDYLWTMPGQTEHDHYQLPKPAIDAFVNIFQRKLKVLRGPLYQLYVVKAAA